MSKGRLEAFSDGVIAIIITIMVLELKVPRGDDWQAVQPLLPEVSSYVVSFVYIGIYWNNHHHLLHATRSVSGGVLWANLHLLFWLSLVPLFTRWVGDDYTAALPTALYAGVLFMSGVSFTILSAVIVRHEGKHSLLGKATGRDFKGKLSAVLYAAAIGLAFVRPWIAQAIFVLVAALWFIPSREIEELTASERR